MHPNPMIRYIAMHLHEQKWMSFRSIRKIEIDAVRSRRYQRHKKSIEIDSIAGNIHGFIHAKWTRMQNIGVCFEIVVDDGEYWRLCHSASNSITSIFPYIDQEFLPCGISMEQHKVDIQMMDIS